LLPTSNNQSSLTSNTQLLLNSITNHH
jgi:hypothetical protein